ncbi:putative uncharacterized transposon-derived protein F54H12.3 [Stylophora pistillata]|uniref:Uncharacterized transposon-derived protein F54H12.3 n=1 Tax=Stylophora pistillata TaxID=50429 RepID=A0A2B4R352_STYPI|nr:putative uncharacterized transposon-derived protein F54H12.3 [Stylophora pistillata]
MVVKGLANMAQLGLANAVKSDYAKSKFKKTASKYVDQALDAFVNDMSKKIRGGGDYNAYDVNQILSMSMYAPGGVNDPTHPLYEGGAFDIHKAIGKLPKPKSGWTLPGHKYTGPYNDLDSQLRFDPKTGQILEIYDPPAGPSDAVAMQHDVDYSVCANKANPKKCKNEADRKMVKALDAIPYDQRQWGHWLARNVINTKQKLGYRYLLMVLDIFSKYGWIVPLKNKKGESVAAGFKQIFAEGRVPKKMWTDKGSEYYNSHVKDLFKAKGVELYSTENEEKSSVCERWNRTIKTKMWKQFTIQNNTVYLDILPKILEKYNNTKHRSIGMTPVEASKKKNENAVYLKLYGKELDAQRGWEKPKFAVGDHVRISKFKRKLFDKGYTPNWSEEIFVVDEVQYTQPITYKLKDLLGEEIKGTFYEQEMLKAKQSLSGLFRIEKVIRKKGKQALVKWSGYPEKFNSWVNMDELETYTKAALLAKGKEMGLKSLTGLNKKGLIEAIKNPAQHITGVKKDSKAELLMKAKEMGLQGLYKLKKKDLIEVIKNPPPPRARHCGVRKKERGLHGHTHLQKDKLIKFIRDAEITDEECNKEEGKNTEKITSALLRRYAWRLGLRGYAKLRKAELIKFIKDMQEKNIKIEFMFRCEMIKKCIITKEVETMIAYFSSHQKIIFQETDGEELYEESVEKMMESLATFLRNKSGWVFNRVEGLDLHTVKYTPFKGSSYIKLPKHLESKKTIINMKNKDEECFKWCVTRALHPVQSNPKRITKILRKQAEKLVWDGIEFPMEVKSISRFEKLNPEIGVNVYMYENGLNPLRVSSITHAVNVVDLLLISEGDKKHYCLIKNLSRLVSSSLSKNEHKKFICRRCLNYFGSQSVLDTHSELCQDHEAVSEKMPKEGTYLSFKNHQKQMTMPFTIYADFESLIKPLDTVQADPKHCYTEKKQQHIPISFCYYVKCTFDDSYSKRVEYTAKSEDEDVAQTFVEALEDEVRSIYKNHPTKEMIFTDIDAAKFQDATCCWLCGEDFEEEKDKVRDHCHYTGKFRGAAHNSCNLKFQRPKFIPVVLHNLANYDAHLFVRNLGVSEGDIDCIPNNEEKYISFTKHIVVDKFFNKEKEKDVEVKRELRFIDSFKFMASSLDKLVNNLAKKGESFFQNTRKYYSGEKLNLLMRKGVYPYEWVNSIQKLDETQLPPKEAFFSVLSGKGISDKDYIHAQNVWSVFRCKTFRDYHNLYNRSDVLLLADVFENFRELCKENYDLDPCWYFTAPGLAWDACLKLTEIELELLSDINMLHMFEAGIRGGISMISTRHAKANNKYMEKSFDPSQPSKFITYLDANNLYGWAMSKSLPTGGFKWVDEKDFGKWKSFACILEVDLNGVKKELHDHFNDYPPAPENLLIGKVHKLVCTLNEKKKYIVHHETLKHYMSLGIEIGKIHRVIRFNESPWMKEYIDLNTKLRAKAKNEFEKDFYKLMNNAVFGKTMENIRKRVDVRLVTREEKAKKLTNKAGIRGGISMISTRHAKANNKYMEKSFDPTQPSKFITYLDANNLYGWAMSKSLPTGGFKWVDEKDFGKWKSFACILEVDLNGVKKELHDHFNDYPPAPENLLIGKVHKLVCTLNEKKKYIVHHETLKHYMSLGIEIGKIHRVIRFNESPWMKEYIDLNTKLRAKAKNEFEKDFYKLMNNAVFGKTMENIRKRVDVRLVTREEKAKKLTNKVNFKHRTIFSEDLCAIHMGKTQIVFNKPLYLGMSILDISKTLMYDFHYNYIKPKYPEGRSKLLFTDTDSLCYEIQTKDFYRDITNDVGRLFDTSNIREGHSSGIPTGVNKKVIGMFKDEAGGKIIEEFVGLRAKLYSYKMFDDGGEKKKCKGVKQGVVDRTISFDDYKRCLFGGGKQLRKMNTLRSRKHEMYMEEINKCVRTGNMPTTIIKGNEYRRVTDLSSDDDAVVYSLHRNCCGGSGYYSAFGKYYIVFANKGTYRRVSNMNKDEDPVEYKIKQAFQDGIYFWGTNDYVYCLKQAGKWGVTYHRSTNMNLNKDEASFSVRESVLKFIPGGIAHTHGKVLGFWKDIKRLQNDSNIAVLFDETNGSKICVICDTCQCLE